MMMTRKKVLRGLGVLTLAFTIGFGGVVGVAGGRLFVAYMNETPPPPPAETCVTGVFLILNDWGGFVAFGDQKLCGVGLHYTDVTGPTSSPNPIYQGGRNGME